MSEFGVGDTFEDGGIRWTLVHKGMRTWVWFNNNSKKWRLETPFTDEQKKPRTLGDNFDSAETAMERFRKLERN